MNALMRKEESMSVEERLAGLESDVKYLRKDVLGLSEDVKSLNRKIQDVGAELDKKIQIVVADLQSFKTDVAKQFGAVLVTIESLKTSIESLKASIGRSKIWMLT